ETSISVELSARTSAEGAIWLISGNSVTSPPTPAALTAAMLMKSRRRTPSPASTAGASVPACSAMVDRALLKTPASQYWCRPVSKSCLTPGIAPAPAPCQDGLLVGNRLGALIDAKIRPANRNFGLLHSPFSCRRSAQSGDHSRAGRGGWPG